jgi:hypothetical protein
MLFTEIIGVDCESHMTDINTLCGKIQRFLMSRQLIRVFTAKLAIGIEAGAKKQLMNSE